MKSNTSINANKGAFFWNSIASVLNSFQSAIILVVISYVTGGNDAGIFVFCYAAANLMMIIGKFGMRQFQVSDINNKYTFSDYLLSRRFTIILMFIISIFYALFSSHGDAEKLFTILLWCGIRGIESYEDVYHGDLQKNGHLDKASMILTFRIFISIIIFCLSYYWKKDLIMSSALTFLFSLTLAIILNSHYKNLYSCTTNANINQVKNLLIENASLFLGYFCFMYLSNAPKYSVNGFLSNEMQAIYGYLFMPVFLIGMLCNFILQPLITTYSQLWNQKNIHGLCRLVGLHLGIIFILTAITILGGKFIGIYLLEIFYNVSLQSYSQILYVLLTASGLIAILSYFTTLLTIMRCQNMSLLIYLGGCILMKIGSPYALNIGGMMEISIYYTAIVFLLDFLLFCLFLHKILHE